MIANNITPIVLVMAAVIVVLLALVIYLFLRIRRAESEYELLTRGAKGLNFVEIVNDNIEEVERLRGEVEDLSERYAWVLRRMAGVIQHVGVVRFDAFRDLGGLLSFAIALLDDRGNGLVFSSIYGRSESRTYSKPVVERNSKYDLSPEEKEAIRLAMQSKEKGSLPSQAKDLEHEEKMANLRLFHDKEYLEKSPEEDARAEAKRRRAREAAAKRRREPEARTEARPDTSPEAREDEPEVEAVSRSSARPAFDIEAEEGRGARPVERTMKAKPEEGERGEGRERAEPQRSPRQPLRRKKGTGRVSHVGPVEREPAGRKPERATESPAGRTRGKEAEREAGSPAGGRPGKQEERENPRPSGRERERQAGSKEKKAVERPEDRRGGRAATERLPGQEERAGRGQSPQPKKDRGAERPDERPIRRPGGGRGGEGGASGNSEAGARPRGLDRPVDRLRGTEPLKDRKPEGE